MYPVPAACLTFPEPRLPGELEAAVRLDQPECDRGRPGLGQHLIEQGAGHGVAVGRRIGSRPGQAEPARGGVRRLGRPVRGSLAGDLRGQVRDGFAGFRGQVVQLAPCLRGRAMQLLHQHAGGHVDDRAGRGSRASRVELAPLPGDQRPQPGDLGTARFCHAFLPSREHPQPRVLARYRAFCNLLTILRLPGE